METALIVVVLAASIILTVSVILQDGKSSGLSGAVGGGTETLFGKTASRGLQATLQRVTVVSAAVFMVAVMAASIVLK